MRKATNSRPVHLVGSVPLSDATEVFTVVSEILGHHVQRFPDGATIPRR